MMESDFPDVLAIMTLYKLSPFMSPALLSIKASRNAKLLFRGLFLYDNCPVAEYSASDIEDYAGLGTVVMKGDNSGGLASAYNAGLDHAGNGGTWIMLLDQDTVFDESFMDAAIRILPRLDENIAAVVPKVRDRRTGRLLSPSRITPLGRFRPISPAESGNRKSVTAINAGALLRTDSLRDIGGFPPDYPLDMLDHVIFMKLGRLGMDVHVLDATIFNELSLSDIATIDAGRYAGFLRSYKRFWKDYGSALQKAANRIMSMYRMVKLVAKGRSDVLEAARRQGIDQPERLSQ